MALIAVILDGLRTEVAASIKALTPQRVIDNQWASFAEHDAVKTGQTIQEMTGVNRLFEIGLFAPIEPTYTGFTKAGRQYELPITFCYHRSPNWNTAAFGDMEEITKWFLNNQGSSGVDGIASRRFDMETPVAIEHHDEDPWDYYTLRMLIWIDETFSN